MAVIYFNGCSITAGHGFHAKENDPAIYPNIIQKTLQQQVINEASGGSSNLKMFHHAAKVIIDNIADTLIIQWSALHRHWLYPSPDNGIYIGTPGHNSPDEEFVVQFQLRNHDYGNILALLDYTRILQHMAKSTNKNICFINGLINWNNSQEYFESLVSQVAVHERFRFIENLQNNIELVDWDDWINPWTSIYESKIDEAPLDTHPGPLTHKRTAEMLLDKLNAL